MAARATRKQRTKSKILEAAARRLRSDGPDGATVGDIMADAGLTHGGFYAHFKGKDDLAASAFRHAAGDARERWFDGLERVAGGDLLRWLAGRYLTPAHRDDRAEGCVFAALSGDAARRTGGFASVYGEELRRSLERLERGGVDESEALAFLALCVGGLSMARAVDDPLLSERILRACRAAAQSHNK
jgi:TetR/AcrR family transcriptional repressor of nem operon